MSDEIKCGCGKSQDPNGFCDGSHKCSNENQVSFKETKIYSFGDVLVGLNIEELPEGVELEVKQKFSEIAEILKSTYTMSTQSPVKSLLFDHAVGEILNAQMSVVKLLKL
jgi:hypothetical protein